VQRALLPDNSEQDFNSLAAHHRAVFLTITEAVPRRAPISMDWRGKAAWMGSQRMG
jgi:hypothetical protein